MKKTCDEQSFDTVLESFSVHRPRRMLLKGAVAGMATGAAFGINTLFSASASAHGSALVQQIIDISVTAERLAVTTYSNGIANAAALGLSGANLNYLQAALVEEQIHELFFEALGAKPLTSTFSYPSGAQTFSNLATFIQTQQQLEGVFDTAFLAAVKELAQNNEPRLAQIFAQIACIEAEHRVLGRVILNLLPADNYAFTPVLVARVSDAPAAIKAAGYTSPVSGNTYTYQQVSTVFAGIDYRTPYTVGNNSGNIFNQ